MKNHKKNPIVDIPEADPHLARKLASMLDELPLSTKQQERLRLARFAALEKARAPVAIRQSRLAGVWHWVQDHSHERTIWLLAAAAAVCLGVAVYWQSAPDAWDDEVDVMLLAGELPPDAYLDDKIDSLAR